MSVKIDDFKAVFESGFARSNRYEVIIPTAGLVGSGGLFNGLNAYDLRLMCDSVTWPGRQLTTQERYTTMKAQKMPYAFAHEDLSISFILNNDWLPWNLINDWQSSIITNIGGFNNFSVNYQNEYARDITIRHLDTENNIRREVLIKKAYPTSLNSIELGNGNDNEVIRVSAEFSYHNWEEQ
jgi:hypothetical protein